MQERKEVAVSQKDHSPGRNKENTPMTVQLKGAITLNRSFEDEYDEQPTFVKMKPAARERYLLRKASHVKPTKKASYEGSSQVQRWLKQQAYDFEPQAEQQKEPSF